MGHDIELVFAIIGACWLLGLLAFAGVVLAASTRDPWD